MLRISRGGGVGGLGISGAAVKSLRLFSRPLFLFSAFPDFNVATVASLPQAACTYRIYGGHWPKIRNLRYRLRQSSSTTRGNANCAAEASYALVSNLTHSRSSLRIRVFFHLKTKVTCPDLSHLRERASTFAQDMPMLEMTAIQRAHGP